MAYPLKRIIKKRLSFINPSQDNNPDAQFNLGLMYRYGIGTLKNQQQAFDYFKQARASNQMVVRK
jgi:TPR repeat protein